MSDMNDWKEQLAKLRGSTSPPEDKTQDKQQGKDKGKKPSKKPPGGKKSPPPRHGGGGGRGNDRYFLPADTLKMLQPELGSKRQKVDNFALLLNKCAFFDSKQKKFILSRQEERRRGVEAYRLTPNFHPTGVKEIAARHEQAINNLGIKIVKLAPLTVDWRLIVGLGTESVYETSMTLHHIYGIPYIPGQAVKGVVRSWLILEKFTDEAEASQDKAFCDIFGCDDRSCYKEARQGNVFFFDTFPTNLTDKSIQPDIMNPHYPDYYSKGTPPADYQNPNPITFLTVKNTTFEFFVGVKPEENYTVAGSKLGTGKLLDIVKQSLKAALTEHGLGAKTAVGYGSFQV